MTGVRRSGVERQVAAVRLGSCCVCGSAGHEGVARSAGRGIRRVRDVGSGAVVFAVGSSPAFACSGSVQSGRRGAAFTRDANLALALASDCMPIVISNTKYADCRHNPCWMAWHRRWDHSGWVGEMLGDQNSTCVWIGPSISAEDYEVDDSVSNAIVTDSGEYDSYLLLWEVAKIRLRLLEAQYIRVDSFTHRGEIRRRLAKWLHLC